MPRGDRTGPAGTGPLTGRAAGYGAPAYGAGCTAPGFMNPLPGWGRGQPGFAPGYQVPGVYGGCAGGWPAPAYHSAYPPFGLFRGRRFGFGPGRGRGRRGRW